MLRNKIADIFDTHIDDKETYEALFERMSIQGRLDIKKMQDMIALILTELENQEKKA